MVPIICIQKIGHYSLQRRTYSMYKGQSQVKRKVSTTGYIGILGVMLDAFWPTMCGLHQKHYGIMRNYIENIMDWLQQKDVFTVDRGFRDAELFINACHITVEAPSNGQIHPHLCLPACIHSCYALHDIHETRMLWHIYTHAHNGIDTSWCENIYKTSTATCRFISLCAWLHVGMHRITYMHVKCI